MPNPTFKYIDKLRETHRCRPEVAEMAACMRDLGVGEYEDLLQKLTAEGEDKAMGILLNVCAVNKVKLSPHLLAETLRIVEPLLDFSLPYRFQDEAAVKPLLEVAQAEDISWQRQAYAGRIAAELAVNLDTGRQAVKKVLLKLSSRIRAPELQWIFDESLILLEKENGPDFEQLFEMQRDPLEVLPAEKPPVILGGRFTMRRPIPKIGRNAPCHCGSGKKYKKCCYEKDQELLRDPSPYQGVTMTQARTSPELVDDARLIDAMRAYELKKLDPTKLTPDQLLAAYRRADLFGLRELAFEMLLELERRAEEKDFDPGHFEDLIYSALDAGNVELVERILTHIPQSELYDPEMIQLNLHLIKHREHFAQLEAECRRALTQDGEPHLDDPLMSLGNTLENSSPALSIVFARAFICGNPDRFLDNETLMDVVRRSRAELGIDPWGDPIEDYLEWCLDKAGKDFEENKKNEEILKLAAKVADAQQRAKEKEKQLRQKENQLNELTVKLERERAASHEVRSIPSSNRVVSPPQEKDTIADLRQRIDGLKTEINSQQQIRRRLRRQLQAEREKVRSEQQQPKAQVPPPKPEISFNHKTNLRKIQIPEFMPPFQRSCESVPTPLVAKALKAAVGFASHDEFVLRQTIPIRRIPGVYRIRIGMQYRLMLRWKPDEDLQILDLIPRSQLETWVKQHAA